MSGLTPSKKMNSLGRKELEKRSAKSGMVGNDAQAGAEREKERGMT
jgi:hypothetical protein